MGVDEIMSFSRLYKTAYATPLIIHSYKLILLTGESNCPSLARTTLMSFSRMVSPIICCIISKESRMVVTNVDCCTLWNVDLEMPRMFSAWNK